MAWGNESQPLDFLVYTSALALLWPSLDCFERNLPEKKRKLFSFMASSSDHSDAEGVGSSATVVDVGVPPAAPASQDQGYPIPDPVAHPAFVPLHRLVELVHGIALSVSVGGGRYYDSLPLVEERLEAVRRAGDASLTQQCERELKLVEGWMYRLEELAYEDISDVPPPLPLYLLLERNERAKRIQAKEAELRRLRRRHQTVLDRMDAYLDRAFFEDAGTLRGEAKLRERSLEAGRLGEAAREVEKALQLLHQEEEDSKEDLARRQQKRKDKARTRRAAERAALKAKIGSFSLLKFL